MIEKSFYNATIVTSPDELHQVDQLNYQNLKQNTPVSMQQSQGFVTWRYPFELLKQMHELIPSIIVKYKNNIAGYALSCLREARSFHPDLDSMLMRLDDLRYGGKQLKHLNYYCMGQVCIDEQHRGKGVFDMLYAKHKEIFSSKFDFLLTEISVNNPRSLRAHEKAGFKIVETCRDEKDSWNVVLWDWK